MKTNMLSLRFLSAKLLVTLGITALVGPAAGLAQQIGSLVLPQLAFGDGWYSAMYFTNLTGEPASFTVSFISDEGTPLSVPALGGTSVEVSLAASGSAVIEAPNSGSTTLQGYATFTLPTGVGGYGIFRRSLSGIADQEAVVPFSNSTNTTNTLTWDETGPSTAIAIMNPSSTAATIAITVWGLDGSMIGTSSLVLQPLHHTALFLKTLPGLSGMAGHQGSAQFSASTGNVAVLGFRANGKAITSIPMTATFLANSVYVFMPGQYAGPGNIENGMMKVDISGAGTLDDGSTMWSLSASQGADPCTYPSTASWYAGPIANSPLAVRLKTAGITSTAWSYGIAQGSNCAWHTGDLVGLSQVGNTVTIADFSNIGRADQSSPVSEVTYTLVTATTAPASPATMFLAGKYIGPRTMLYGKQDITIDGPGATSAGVTAWSLSATPGADVCTYPSSAQFYPGPIASNPFAARIQKAGIASTALSYGVGNGGTCNWHSEVLLGFSQTGNAVTIQLFTDAGVDYSAPIDEITYLLVTPQ